MYIYIHHRTTYSGSSSGSSSGAPTSPDGSALARPARCMLFYDYILYIYIYIYIYKITKFQIEHWDQSSNVKVFRR